MKVILYMALTANGMIAEADGNSNWVSNADIKSFTNICEKTGAVIMGRHTYDVLVPDELPLQKGIQIVISTDSALRSDNPTVSFMNKSPRDILIYLESEGYNSVCLIGGSQTVSQFMQQRLVNEIYFDIEPLLFGNGIPLFKDVDFKYNLELLEVKNLTKNTIQLHYKVTT